MKEIKKLKMYLNSQLLLNKEKMKIIEQRTNAIKEFIELIDSMEAKITKTGITD